MFDPAPCLEGMKIGYIANLMQNQWGMAVIAYPDTDLGNWHVIVILFLIDFGT